MNTCSYESFFVHFANRTKLAIIQELMDGPRSVSEMAHALGSEQSKISHNLSTLLYCNIITVQQEGKKRIYTLNKKTVLPMMKIVQEHVQCFCKECRKL
ncbi:MAG: ArsR/SmtB family transcription factor [Nanoarchaeota archaeon]